VKRAYDAIMAHAETANAALEDIDDEPQQDVDLDDLSDFEEVDEAMHGTRRDQRKQ
jgi:hypothetical protein